MKKAFCAVVAVAAIVVTAAQTNAVVPPTMNYQGRLTNAAGQNVADGNYSVQFTIYDAAMALWAESLSVSVSSGLFAVTLGQVHPLPSSLFANPDLWLGTKVGTDPELSPRTKLTAVAYSFATDNGGVAYLPLTGGTMTGPITNAGDPDITMGKGNFGASNTNVGSHAFVAGLSNDADGDYSAVGGGFNNTASGDRSVIAGGASNGATGPRSSIGGGSSNSASGAEAVVAGGGNNTASGANSAVGGGFMNSASGDYSAAAGYQSQATGNYSVASGYQGVATFNYSVVSGGKDNSAGFGAAVGGGSENSAMGPYSTVSGGDRNTASGTGANVSGGILNRASGVCAAALGGTFDTASGNYSVASGYLSVASGDYSVAMGLDCKASAYNSFAVGHRAKAQADDSGSFVWGDATNSDVSSLGDNSFVVRATGGVFLMQSRLYVDKRALSSEQGAPGLYWRDNSIVAWGKVSGSGSIGTDEYGVSSVVRNSSGNYTITVDNNAMDNALLIPIAVAECDVAPSSAATARIVSINQVGTDNFRVYIMDGTWSPVDNDFVFMVTAR